jgi:serine/threonine protein kinase
MPNGELEEVAQKICQKRHLRFVRCVGEGAFKQTFHVIDGKNTPLALKVFKASNSNRRDQREIEAMLRCKHKNIAGLLAVENYSLRGQQFVVITEEFLPGGTLTARGRLSVPQCIGMGKQLVEAIAHIASLNLVHRDIKPDNILFRADDSTPVITDFGVVRDLTDSSITPTWAARGPGTPLFSAPEQLNNEKCLIDWRTDQFALGVVLAYSAFGAHPYGESGISDRDIVDRVSTRHGPADWFGGEAVKVGLPHLLRMVAAWPVDRFRRPGILIRVWSEEKG